MWRGRADGRQRARRTGCIAIPRQHRIKLHSASSIERLHQEVKRRADVEGVRLRAWLGGGRASLPNEDTIMRLIFAALFERNDEWWTASRYMRVEASAQIGAEETGPNLGIQAA